jgi:hypothetical protein
MKSLEELKEEVLTKLAWHPKIEAFFKDSLEERMKINDCWTENALVLILLDDEFFKQSALHTLIDPLHNDHKNFNTLRCKLNPRDEYDKKIRDVLAELNAYYRLVNSGFEKIEALPEDSKQKKPDFSAKLEGEAYLCEVKNVRAPVDICDLLFIKTEARRHRVPEIYRRILIYYSLSEKWREVELNRPKTDGLKTKVEDWIEKTFTTIESSKAEPLSSVKPLHLTNEGLVIECRLKAGKNLAPAYGFIGGINVNDFTYKQSLLSPLENKIRRICSDASGQLLQYDKTNQHKKYVLLNWQQRKKSTIRTWDGFENDVDKLVKRIDIEVKNLSRNLFARLLNVDSLP